MASGGMVMDGKREVGRYSYFGLQLRGDLGGRAAQCGFKREGHFQLGGHLGGGTEELGGGQHVGTRARRPGVRLSIHSAC